MKRECNFKGSRDINKVKSNCCFGCENNKNIEAGTDNNMRVNENIYLKDTRKNSFDINKKNKVTGCDCEK